MAFRELPKFLQILSRKWNDMVLPWWKMLFKKLQKSSNCQRMQIIISSLLLQTGSSMIFKASRMCMAFDSLLSPEFCSISKIVALSRLETQHRFLTKLFYLKCTLCWCWHCTVFRSGKWASDGLIFEWRNRTPCDVFVLIHCWDLWHSPSLFFVSSSACAKSSQFLPFISIVWSSWVIIRFLLSLLGLVKKILGRWYTSLMLGNS